MKNLVNILGLKDDYLIIQHKSLYLYDSGAKVILFTDQVNQAHIHRCTDLIVIGTDINALDRVEISSCVKLKTLKDITAKEIVLYNLSISTYVGKMKAYDTILINGLNSILDIPGRIISDKVLSITNCQQLEHINYLDSKTITIGQCPNLKSIGKIFVSGVLTLSSELDSLETLPDIQFVGSTAKVEFSYDSCPKLKEIPDYILKRCSYRDLPNHLKSKYLNKKR